MSTHDMNIANQGFPAFRADLNNALAALVSNSSSATEPTTTFAYQFWADTGNDLLKQRNAANDGWVSILTLSTGAPVAVQSDKISEGNSSIEVIDSGTGYAVIVIDGVETARFDANGRLGLGTTNPSNAVHIYDDSGVANGVRITSATNASAYFVFGDTADTTRAGMFYDHAVDALYFWANNAERARIDSSGNLLVGKTSSSFSVAGHSFLASGYAGFTRDGGNPVALNRLTSDGDLIRFDKDGSTIGSLGVDNSVGVRLPYLGSNNFSTLWANAALLPANGSGAVTDNAYDIGASGYRWDDIFATNGTIQTSDANEKQDIAELDEAEQRVAQACKGLLRKFRWISAVEEKGDDARIHFGIIAQDLKAAFEAEGLDAGRYAMFTSATWWEAEEIVPAVEAKDAVFEEVTTEALFDADGNEVVPASTQTVLVSEAIEAKAEYTRVVHYDSAEEAPEGAVERTRMGVRYPELLAFIIASI